MPVYFVRIIESRDLVGIFSAADVDQLMMIVDECTDPDRCEYQLMGPGGIHWPSPAIAVPIDKPLDDDDDGSQDDPIPWDAVNLSDNWWNYFHGYAKGKWRAIIPDAPPRPPRSEPPPSPMGPGRVLQMKKRGV